VLDPGRPVPQGLFKALVGRIKVIGRMDVAERLVPQDGRTSLRIGERAIDVRISTIPTAYGERVVLRLLDSGSQLLDMPALGMPAHIVAPFAGAAGRSSGIVLVTGPTGSGKTTTLYATLRSLQATELNIMTIEDPIEYELSSLGIPISQSQVNPKKGVNFANGLRHILRQDPDVIMVGEIRDAETARIAIQASLTGHLVFSTLHTNDAVTAVTRLIDLGVEPYLVASSLSAVLAQRLVRTCCATCGGKRRVDETPCATCHGTGYKGRTGLFELLSVDEPLRGAITRGAGLDELRGLARAGGMRSLGDEGAALMAAGRTTADEVERVVHHG
jgi:general secretion pathway protein E